MATEADALTIACLSCSGSSEAIASCQVVVEAGEEVEEVEEEVVAAVEAVAVAAVVAEAAVVDAVAGRGVARAPA